MSKSTSYFFSHDYNTRTDDKIKNLIRKHGMTGYGIYWAIIEDLYNNANALQLDYYGIAYDLRVDEEVVKSIINDFGLFVIDGDKFGSFGVQDRLDQRSEKSKNAYNSARIRWDRVKNNANALRTESDGNAIKESKGKEIKERKVSIDTVVPPYSSPEFLEVWNLLLTENKHFKKKTAKQLQRIADDLKKHTEQEAIEAIGETFKGGWMAIHFKEKRKPIINPNQSKGMFEAAEELRKSLEEF